jgi:hypothetical protein
MTRERLDEAPRCKIMPTSGKMFIVPMPGGIPPKPPGES